MPGFSFLGKQRMNEDFSETPKVWHSHPIHCLDFEGSLRSGVLEYGLVTFQDLEVVSIETRLCGSSGPIPEMETATHLIRESDVVSLEPLSGSWDLFRDKRTTGPFAAHHAGVENGLIKSVWPFTTPSPNFISGATDVDWGPWLDTCALYRALFPGLESYNLAALIEQFSLAPKLEAIADKFCPTARSSYHCAPYDAAASAVLLIQLASYDEIKDFSLSQMMQWSQPGKGGAHSGSQMELL